MVGMAAIWSRMTLGSEEAFFICHSYTSDYYFKKKPKVASLTFSSCTRNQTALPPDATLWTRLAPQMDCALERLRTKQRNAVLLCAFLNHDFASAAKVLRTSERRVEKRLGRGMKKLANRLQKRRAPVDPGALASACATEGCAATVPQNL